jgi:ABC-type spermidine/putrescine transport system permease subunit I
MILNTLGSEMHGGILQDFHFNPSYKWILKKLTNPINVFIFHLLILAYFLAKWIWDCFEDKLDGCHLMNSITPSYTPCIIYIYIYIYIYFIAFIYNIAPKKVNIEQGPKQIMQDGFYFQVHLIYFFYR